MPSVTLEFRTEDLTRLGVIPEGLFPRYEEVELLRTLRLEEGWRLELLRVRRRGVLKTGPELERESRRIRRAYGLDRFELIERRPRTRDYIVLARQRNPDALQRWLALAAGRITPAPPFRLDPERTVSSFTGETRALRRVLKRLDREGLTYRVVRAGAHPEVEDGEAPGLTPLQTRVITRAWILGFFAVPRRITLTQLARHTGRSAPALGKILRRAEGRLVSRWLSSEGAAVEPARAA